MMSHRRYTYLKLIWVTAAVTTSALIVAPDTQAQTDNAIPGDPVAGRRFFVEHDCVRCHSIWGNGGTLGPDFATLGTGRSLQQLAGLFWNHTPRMIETVRGRGFEWPQFSEEELADIISYVYYVKLFDEPGDFDLGERWFQEKRCSACHSVGGVGGRSGGALDQYARYIAPVALAQGMWNHGPAMQSLQMTSGIAMPTFLGREIADLQAYIRGASTLRDREVALLPPPNPNQGRQLFSTKGCSACHGRRGNGTSFGPDLREATQHMRVSEIAGRLWNHSARMVSAVRSRGIEFPRFEGTEMADIIAFLYYLRFYDTEGDSRRGAEVFVQKGCAVCHARDGEATVGPDLAGTQSVLTPLGLATAMWNHAPAMYDLAQVQHTEWPVFEGNEMRDLSAYLHDVATARVAGTGSEPEPDDGSDR
jgi:mono/diheme cytochrome c family protein